MTRYYWSKYNVITKTSYIDTAPWVDSGIEFVKFSDCYRYWNFNGTSNLYSVNTLWNDLVNSFPAGTMVYKISSGKLVRYTADATGTAAESIRCIKHIKDPSSNNISVDYSRGSLLQSGIIAEDGTYPIDGRYTDGYWYVRNGLANSNPTLKLNSPTDNVTLYENDRLNIEGYAADVDNGNIVNARYQLDGGTVRALVTAISDGTTPIAFNKQLTFKGGKLYDGETAITNSLEDRVAHQLKVWSEDDQGGKSTEQIRSFYVVPNRAPALTVDKFETKSDLINVDKITITGTASDIDGNDVVVSYRLNKGLNTEIYRGKDSPWSFDLSLKNLVDGENTIVIEVVDSYNFKTSKTLKLNKNLVATPLLQSVKRYQIVPPSGSAKGVLLWVQRQTGLTVTADISMGLKGEQEVYEPMLRENSAPVTMGIIEDEFIFESDAPKDNIVVKLTLTRDSADVSDAITLISGVLS